MSYKHGVYGTVAETYEATSVAQGTIPAYIGSAPIHRINPDINAESNWAEYVNKPILISSLREARDMGLYSDDWKTYTLCEAIHAHFMNGTESIAPIILVNTLNPESDKKSESVSATVTMRKVGTKFVGYIEDALCLIKDLALTISEDVGATKEDVTYYYNGDKVVVEADITFSEAKKNTISFDATAVYHQVEFSAEKFTEESVTEALNSLDYCDQITGVIPNIIAAPAISEKPNLHSLMIQKAIDKIAAKWNVICVSDIPASEVTTYDGAIKWKDDNAYESKYDKVYFGKLAYGDKIYHASTIGAYMMQKIDTQNNNIPYVSASNKVLFCDRVVVGDDVTLQISEQNANKVNEVGITTVNFINGGLRFWGAHMSNYNYSKIGSIAPEDRFDSSVRMSLYLLNYLQNKYINEIDESFTKKDVDSIVNGIQTWLDSLVNDGMLLYATVSFNNESNSNESLSNGDFVFDLEVTYCVLAKSITFKLQYTSTGLVSLTDEGGV